MDYQKGLHYSHELERVIIGVCIYCPGAMARTYGTIKPEYFWHEVHRNIYQVLEKMFKEHYPIDYLTVIDFLFRREKFVMADGKPVAWWISQVINEVVSDAHLDYWAQVIAEMYLQRELIALTHGGVNLDGDSRQMIGELTLKLNQLNERRTTTGDFKDAETLVYDLYQHQDEILIKGGMGIKTGFYGVDKINGGFHPGQSVILAARPSVGKSALAGEWALNMAQEGVPVGVIELEMSNNELTGRMASSYTGFDFNTIYRNLFEDEQSRNIFYHKMNTGFSKLPIFVSDKTGEDIHEIRAKATKLKAAHNIEVLFIDYLQLVKGTDKKGRNREQEISEISRGIKMLAKDLNIPVIALAQLNRDIAKRKGKDRYPHLTDLRESGSLEQDADVVMFLHRDSMAGRLLDEDGTSTEGQADLIVRKWRNAALGWVKLKFEPTRMKFYEPYPEAQEPAPQVPVQAMLPYPKPRDPDFTDFNEPNRKEEDLF